ncbi:MAG: hypothetical protein JSR58_07290 [Verrucomicrobia bacterium]|nr:hypothetical protein [Verrucomicrobiota bacterium]
MAATASWTGSLVCLGSAALITKLISPQMHPAFGAFYVLGAIAVTGAVTYIPRILIKNVYLEKVISYPTLAMSAYGTWRILHASGNTATPTQVFVTICGAYLCAEAANEAWHRFFNNKE